jgi:hypothetical protein
MVDASVPMVNRRTLLKGSAALVVGAGVGAAALGMGNYWLGRGSHVSRSLGKKVIVIGVVGMDPGLVGKHDEGRSAPEPGKTPSERWFQQIGHEHASPESRRVG